MLRGYQVELSKEVATKLKELRICYMAMEMRVGKTLIALSACDIIGCKRVLFVTPKLAISSIENDFRAIKFDFELEVTNYEQLHRVKPEYDCYIIDESHKLGQLGKPSIRVKLLKKLVKDNYLLLLSGTPSPESYSQLFHQFYISDYSPFEEKNFYLFADNYIDVCEKYVKSIKYKDYRKGKRDLILSKVERYFVNFTRQQAGFTFDEVDERVITLQMPGKLQTLIKILLSKKYYRFKDGSEIVCDSAVKLQSKIHQISSGTVKDENGGVHCLDDYKALYVLKSYSNKKIAIYYKFIAEGMMLKEILQNTTGSPEDFNSSEDKIFISQIQSGSMGINLESADILIFFNIDFSSVQYWQARSRLQSINRETRPEVHWLFSDYGIESKVYDIVQNKKDYTTYYFMKDFYGKDYQNGKLFAE